MPDEAALTRRALLAATGSAAATSAAGCTGVVTPADLAQASGGVERLAGVVDAAWLAEHREQVVVLDARHPEPFRQERIYGARSVDVEAVTSRRSTPDGLVPDASAMAGAFGAAGVRPDDDVVVYGSSVGSRVTRLVFALEHLGHRGDIAVLAGGFESWPGRVGTGDREPERTEYRARPRPNTIVTRTWIADRLGSFNAGGPSLIDVRPPEAYLGARKAAAIDPTNARHGHLPGAVDVHWVGNVQGRTFAKPADLAGLYFAGAGVDEDGTTVVYGASNVNPTNTYVVLQALGASDVRLYEGGFEEWANVPPARRAAYPVETKTRAVIETAGSVGGGGSGAFSCTG
ncbi:MAG: sulfurtransferase [Halobacteriales archaeon]